MGTTLDALRRLQEVHSRLSGLRQKEESKRREIRQRQRKVEECRLQVERITQQVREQQKQIDEVDLEIKTRQAAIDKHREALNRSKTNREYSTILTSLNTEKADIGRLENRALQLMGEVDKLRSAKESQQAEWDRAGQRVREAEKSIQEFLATVGADLQRLTQERAAAAARVPAEALQKFERAAEKNEGEALAQIIKVHPKREEYSCGACNMGITLEQKSALSGRDEIQTCNVCGAILYLGPESGK